MPSKAELRGTAVTLAKGLGITVDVATKNHAELTRLVDALRQQAPSTPVDPVVVPSEPGRGALPTPPDAESIAPLEAPPAPPLPPPPPEKPHRVAKPVVSGSPLVSESLRQPARPNHTGYVMAEGRSVTTMNGDMRHSGAPIKAKDFDADTLDHLLAIGVITKSTT